MEDQNKNSEGNKIINKEENIINENDLNEDNNQSKNQDGNIKFDKNLANQEWINERNYLRDMTICVPTAKDTFETYCNDLFFLGSFFHYNELYFLNQDKFMKAVPLGNRICSIGINFASNIKYVQMFGQKYFIGLCCVRSFFGNDIAVMYNVYVYSMFKEKLSNNQEIQNFVEDCRAGKYSICNYMEDINQGLDSEKISLDDRKKFDDIVNDFFDLSGGLMRCVVELFFRHQNYSDTFYVQGRIVLHFNVNTLDKDEDQWYLDFPRNPNLRDQYNKANSRRWETLSYYSRHMILCFFRPEYLYKNEKPDPELVEFYVALNSLLSIVEKENAKAILNTDDKKLTEQQQETKNKLLGMDKTFCNNIINAWKDGFFLDKNKIKKLYDRSDEKNETYNLFEDKEKKFKDDFNKINENDLKSRCFIYDEKNGFVKIIDWLISEIENDNLTLMQQENNLKDDLSSKNDDNGKVDFLVAQLFSGARIADKDNMTYLKFSDEERNKYSQSDLPEKLKLIDNKIQFSPKAAKILKPSDHNLDVYDYDHLKKEKLSELLYFENDEQKRDYIYLRENKDYYRDYVLHQDYGENELYNKLYQCTQKADFGKYKREHFIFDKNGTIIGMDVFAYFADEIVSGELILKNKEGKDISDEVKNIDNDLAREVFLMDKLKNNEYSVCDSSGNKIEMDFDSMVIRSSIIKDLELTIKSLRTMKNGKYEVKKCGDGHKEFVVDEIAVNNLFNNLSSGNEKSATIKDFIEMFRLEEEDIKEIVRDIHEPHALIYRYCLNKIFTEKINPVNEKNKGLIGSYVFDFSQAGCERNDLVFNKDGRVEYVKSESLSRVLKLDEIKTLELQARNNFIKDCKYDASNNKELQKAKNAYKDYKVSKEDLQAAEDELKNLRADLDSNACANLSDFYDFDSYRDEFLDAYIKFYQDAKIDYGYWCSECAKKFLKDIKEKKEKNNDELANIELKFFKGQAIKQEDLSQYTKENKQGEIEDIELKRFKDKEIKFDDLSQHTRNNRQKEIIEIEVELLKQNDSKKKNQSRDASPPTRQNFKLQKQKIRLIKIKHRLESKEINKQTGLEKIDINGETIFYSSNDFDNQQLKNEINILIENNVGLYKSKGIPYKIWDSNAKDYYFDKLQWKWFKIGLVPLGVFVLSVISFFIPPLQGYLVIKIIFTSVSFVCGCLVVEKGIKNCTDHDYNEGDTYDNLPEIPSSPSKQNNLNDLPGITSINDPKKIENDKTNLTTNNNINNIIRNDSEEQKESYIISTLGDGKTDIITGNDMIINNIINITENIDSSQEDFEIPNQGGNKENSQIK